MEIFPYRLRLLKPPQDNLQQAIRASKLSLREGDIIAVSSKVVSIGEGRTVPIGTTSKEKLVLQEASWYRNMPESKYRRVFTIADGVLVGMSGVDESNGAGHYILYPKRPMKSAARLLAWFKKTYRRKKLGLIITDSTSIPLRRGALAFALGWAGFAPLRDYRGSADLFERKFVYEVANVADSLATAANLLMGEGKEQTPVAVISGAPVRFGSSRSKESLAVEPSDDLFAPLFFSKKWKRGKRN